MQFAVAGCISVFERLYWKVHLETAKGIVVFDYVNDLELV